MYYVSNERALEKTVFEASNFQLNVLQDVAATTLEPLRLGSKDFVSKKSHFVNQIESRHTYLGT